MIGLRGNGRGDLSSVYCTGTSLKYGAYVHRTPPNTPLGKLGAPRWRELLMPDLLAEVACGGVSTAAVSAALNPVDVIKTRRISPTHSTAHGTHGASHTHEATCSLLFPGEFRLHLANKIRPLKVAVQERRRPWSMATALRL